MHEQPYPSAAETHEAFARHVSPAKVGMYRNWGVELVMGERSGVTFTDAYTGRRFYNCHSNGGVFNLGHRNPQVIAAVTGALGSVDIGNHHLVSGHRAKLAGRLAATTDGALPGVVFGAAAGEAMDLAIKTARGVTGRTRIVSARGGYHGHTGLALAAGDPQYRDPFGANLPGFAQVPFDDLAALDRAVGDDTAAVILETVPATLGMPIPSPGYLEGVSDMCRERGAAFILDEVQTGLGRTGRMWGYQHYDVTPDMVVTGKGLSGGIYPISATLMSRPMHALFDDLPFVHMSTFGGAEPGCAAALAVLDAVETPGFLERVELLGERFEKSFTDLPFRLRRLGMMMGFKFEAEGAGVMATRVLYDAGVFAVYANNDTSALQFLPPLVLTDEEAGEIIERVRGALG